MLSEICQLADEIFFYLKKEDFYDLVCWTEIGRVVIVSFMTLQVGNFKNFKNIFLSFTKVS